MAINSAEFPYDMSAWVCEKSYKTLRNACRLVEWFNRKGETLADSEKEEIEEALFYIIRNGAALLALATRTLTRIHRNGSR
jgi:hypothetical protein